MCGTLLWTGYRVLQWKFRARERRMIQRPHRKNTQMRVNPFKCAGWAKIAPQLTILVFRASGRISGSNHLNAVWFLFEVIGAS